MRYCLNQTASTKHTRTSDVDFYLSRTVSAGTRERFDIYYFHAGQTRQSDGLKLLHTDGKTQELWEKIQLPASESHHVEETAGLALALQANS